MMALFNPGAVRRHVRRLGLIALIALQQACAGPAPAQRDPAPPAHRVEVASPGPWTPDPRDRAQPPLNLRPDQPIVPPGTVASAVGDLPLTTARPDPRAIKPGEAAIHQPDPTRTGGPPANHPPVVALNPRSEILPRPENEPRALDAAWLAGSAYNLRYRPDQVTRFEAVVQAVETFVPAKGAEPGLLLRVKSAGEERLVHVAPLRDLRSRGTRFNYQDPVTIEACPATIDGQTVYLALQITRGEDTLTFRERESGRPLWDTADAP